MASGAAMTSGALGGGRAILQHPGLLLAALAVLLPWLSWIHLTSKWHSVAALHTPQWLFIMGTLGVLGLFIAQTDGWLGALVAYTALRGVTADYLGTFEVAYCVGFGALTIWAVQQVPRDWHPVIVSGVVASACLEVLYLIQQAMGFDLLWGHWDYAPGWLFGTMGNPSYVGAYLGMVMPLAPWWLLPVFLTGLSLTQSMTGCLAAAAGLCVRYRLYRHRVWRLAALLAFVTGWAWYEFHGISTLTARLIVWTLAAWQFLEHPAAWLFGFGLGAWIPLQAHSWPWVVEVFYQAHNDYLQWTFDAGLIGSGMILAWGWRHRAAWTAPDLGGAMVAVAVAALTLFTFHLAIPALTGCVILGLGTATEGGPST